MTENEYSVYQWFPNDEYECYMRNVGPEDAIKGFMHCCTSVGARLGITRRVILTDGDDCTNMEWEFENGITYPETYFEKLKHGIR